MAAVKEKPVTVRLSASIVRGIKEISQQPLEETAKRLIREGIAVERKINGIGKIRKKKKK